MNNLPEVIKHPFSDKLNKDEWHYRQVIQPQEKDFANIDRWLQRINDGRRDLLPQLFQFVRFQGVILELGAGSCWFSGELSRIQAVQKIYSLEMSEYILSNITPHVLESVNAEAEKINRVVGDFHQLHFPDATFDFVVFDAALHHIPIESYHQVLTEIYRVLKPDGRIVTIREPFLKTIPFYRNYLRRQFGAHEKKYGVTENIFSKAEWIELFVKAGFSAEFYPIRLDDKRGAGWKRMIKKVLNIPLFKNTYDLFVPNYFMALSKIKK